MSQDCRHAAILCRHSYLKRSNEYSLEAHHERTMWYAEEVSWVGWGQRWMTLMTSLRINPMVNSQSSSYLTGQQHLTVYYSLLEINIFFI